jgi:hypothetical protein
MCSNENVASIRCCLQGGGVPNKKNLNDLAFTENLV